MIVTQNGPIFHHSWTLFGVSAPRERTFIDSQEGDPIKPWFRSIWCSLLGQNRLHFIRLLPLLLHWNLNYVNLIRTLFRDQQPGLHYQTWIMGVWSTSFSFPPDTRLSNIQCRLSFSLPLLWLPWLSDANRYLIVWKLIVYSCSSTTQQIRKPLHCHCTSSLIHSLAFLFAGRVRNLSSLWI